MKRKIKMNDKFTSDDILVALCQKSVSYTHLDVYKRQAYQRNMERNRRRMKK